MSIPNWAVSHRGLEASATINSGQGLVAVLGGVAAGAGAGGSGEAATAEGTPLGSVPLVPNANLDYAPPAQAVVAELWVGGYLGAPGNHRRYHQLQAYTYRHGALRIPRVRASG
jgi:hypothetical protein